MDEEDFEAGIALVQHFLEVGMISLPIFFGMNGFVAALVLANWRFELDTVRIDSG